jgi:hypothetical protein
VALASRALFTLDPTLSLADRKVMRLVVARLIGIVNNQEYK